jgi:ATP-dependent protease HslVU (ClpYQ) ATPase subunit
MLTPIEILDELNRHVIGQTKAKRALAVAARYILCCLVNRFEYKGQFEAKEAV